jgi:multidrug efflux system membrane fusion protein
MSRRIFHFPGTILIAALVSAGPAAALAQPAPVPVEVAEVRSADVPLVLQGIGNVLALNTVTVTAQVSGYLQEIRFTEGQPVKAGDVLAQIDPRPFQATLDQAIANKAQVEATLKEAQLDLERFTVLARQNSIAIQQLTTQQATVANLQAQIQTDTAAIEFARTQLGYTTLASPIDGITGIRLVDQGNLVLAANNTPIVVVTQVRPIAVIFTLPAENLTEIRQAMAAGPLQVSVQERQNAKPLGQGTLLLVNNQIDSTSGELQLKATLPNEDLALWPGQYVTAQLLVRVERGVSTVPSTAIQRGPNGYWVYVVKPDQTVAVQPVQVRRFGNNTAVLESGPAPGTTVVTAGQYRLTPGAHITVAQTQPAAPIASGAP